MYSTDVVGLNDVFDTWVQYDTTGELCPTLNIDPYFEEESAFVNTTGTSQEQQ